MDARLDHLTERLAAVVPAAGKLQREELEDIIKAIEALHLARPNPDELWTPRRIALYTGLDEVLVNRLLKSADAPQPIVGERVKVWRARDVFAWIDRQNRPSLRVVK